MGRARLAILALCVTPLIPGCASYRPMPISPAENAAALEARSLDDPRLQRFISAELGAQSPADRPWDLPRLTLAALYFHPDLDIARARLAAARAAAVTAGQRQNPTLDLAAAFGVGAAAGAIPAGAAPVTIGPVVNFVIETFDKREYRSAQARHLAEAARRDVSSAEWQVRGRVRDALIDLWGGQHRLALMRHRLELQDQLVGLLASRLAAGAASALDVSRERVQRAQLALAVRNIEQALADAHARLATAIGVPLLAIRDTPLAFAALDHPAVLPSGTAAAMLRRRALTRRSDVAAALAEYEAAQSALQLAIADQYPNVTMGPGYQYDFGVDKYLIGPSVMLPIFNRNEGPIAERLAARRAAAARFTAVQAAIIGAIDRAAADDRAASAAAATADTLVADARRREEQVRRSFSAGQIDRPTLVIAELGRNAAETSRLDALIAQRKTLGQVEDGLQIPLFDPAAPLPGSLQNPRLPAEPGL